ncbi:F-box protein GID2 isoform X2 [Cajanus cajan]|uniref:F-box protein GID2 n=2 Tax=Cajanus cajan TaxID=3821 RepID=A0A151TTV7_CAJCA|nr:F-box protein GID2 isoform X2 [Cajanus cajan]KYP70456.1 F-box protein GID2 [Cajanus cajan]
MKRPASGEGEGEGEGEMKMKKAKAKAKAVESKGLGCLDSNLVFEVLKHVDARTLGMAACVNKEWQKTAQDERLWELICTKLWANTGCGEQQLRSVVLALGGFRRLLALYLFPLSKPLRLGKDELHLSLSLLSIRYFENINFNNTPT